MGQLLLHSPLVAMLQLLYFKHTPWYKIPGKDCIGQRENYHGYSMSVTAAATGHHCVKWNRLNDLTLNCISVCILLVLRRQL